MTEAGVLTTARQHLAVGVSVGALLCNLGAPLPAAAQAPQPPTASPIQHVIVIIGENRTFDHIFATYQPKHGSVFNLLSEGIVKADGSPGPNYALSVQNKASDTGVYSVAPKGKTPYKNNPPVVTGGPELAYGEQLIDAGIVSTPEQIEPGFLPLADYDLLLTGGTGLTDGGTGPDTRMPNVLNLPAGVFQLTPGVPYDAYASSPVHRFYQMWQQEDCSAASATATNPSGCLHDLFPWVETTIGAGSNGLAQPNPFTSYTTGEGSTSMEFYNMQQGDAPYLKYLADHYTISDNYHQAGMGGTGLNHILLGFADAIWYSDGNGKSAVPPTAQIENPNALAGTNNWYSEDGYGGFNSKTSTPYGGGSYSDCADTGQAGVYSVNTYLRSLAKPIRPNCDTGHYYLLNNYNPGYNADGTLAVLDSNSYASFTVPPTKQRHIGDALMEKGISFKYYGDGWDLYQSDPNFDNPLDAYCNICNPFQYATDIMTNPTLRSEHIQDLANFYEDVADNNLPAVSYIKPSGFVDGHPASSKLDLFEAFSKKVVNAVRQQPALWAHTAIFITFDEGGGYFDSGYVQPLDFFGDGTRIPLIIVSPYTEGGWVSHSYSDHVSIAKFIERNWGLSPLTSRSRDNDPNPVASASNPYVPTNTPAIDDLFDAFQFGRH
ncbi:MAG TPA: alkaline phosphatase family protein [Verrucomicrobiae bacterium]|nr:alkaline phosphatase family protein [Verrucomicrobiae bacterium]